MISVSEPASAAVTLPMPTGKDHSRNSPRKTQPQPMKMAEEYRLVTTTKGRSIRYMRVSKPIECTHRVTTASQKADRFSATELVSQPTHARMNTKMYSTQHL